MLTMVAGSSPNKKSVTAQLRLFGGNAAQIDLGGKPPADGGPGDVWPVPISQGLPQDGAGILAVIQNFRSLDAQAVRRTRRSSTSFIVSAPTSMPTIRDRRVWGRIAIVSRTGVRPL